MPVTAPLTVTVSATQRRILAQLAHDGADNTTIARRLGMSKHTVGQRIHEVLRTTPYTNRTALAVALIHGRLRLRCRGHEQAAA